MYWYYQLQPSSVSVGRTEVVFFLNLFRILYKISNRYKRQNVCIARDLSKLESLYCVHCPLYN